MKASIIFTLNAAACAVANPPAPLERSNHWTVGERVQTSSGPVDGHSAPSATEVSEYLGIPFAKPPVGELRFEPPQSYTGDSVINGTTFVSKDFLKEQLSLP